MGTSTPAAFDPREDIVIVREQISVEELTTLTLRMDGELVKAVVDVRRRIMAVGARFHAELEAALLTTVLSRRMSGESICILRGTAVPSGWSSTP